MKSYFLEELADEQQARDVLSATLPAQSDPWIVPDGHGWTIAFFNIVTLEDDGGLAIMAEISGRHYEKDAEVIAVLRLLRAELGGVIRDDFDNDIV
ncbi:MAG: hypothetical protein HOQ25_05110 [Mesorhizobium sp.]|nr:hypothetical protein [Mesorhizobium sp.]